MANRIAPEDRFWPKVNRNGPVSKVRPDLGPCWQRLAGVFENQYGAFRWEEGKTGRAHRYSYELHIGPIPTGLVIDHLCKNTRCVNPGHMEPVTNGQNVLRGDSFSGENSRKFECPSGHPLTPKHNSQQRE